MACGQISSRCRRGSGGSCVGDLLGNLSHLPTGGLALLDEPSDVVLARTHEPHNIDRMANESVSS